MSDHQRPGDGATVPAPVASASRGRLSPRKLHDSGGSFGTRPFSWHGSFIARPLLQQQLAGHAYDLAEEEIGERQRDRR